MDLPDRDDDAAKVQEQASVQELFASAYKLRNAEIARVRRPPLFVLEGAKTMARHLGMPAEQMQELVPAMAFWQVYLASTLARNPAVFAEAGHRFPSSYEVVRSAVAEMQSHRQLVFVAFHMAAMPLIAAFLALAVVDIHGRPGHALMSPQNLARAQGESGRWIFNVANVIGADGPGLRRLLSGLRDGTVPRLLILLDGPQRPGGPGTCALGNTAPGIAFKTGLISKILAMGIPMRPLTHTWQPDGLELKWHPFLGDIDAVGDGGREDAISRVASLIEDLLKRHPEQWLNWSAPSLRT